MRSIRGSEGLEHLFAEVGRGMYPPFDALTEVMPRPSTVPAAVFSFTGHHVVAADVDPGWVQRRCPPGDLVAPINAAFLVELGNLLDCRPGSLCLVFCAAARPGKPGLELVQTVPDEVNPRIARAHRLRTDVRVYRTLDGAGLLTLGRGIGNRWEAGFEVAEDHRNRGLGRALAAAALHLIAPGAPLFMEVALGNVASIRTILAAGFVPIGAEVLFASGSG